jgi:hypothetical protein
MGPSIIIGATTRSWRKAAMKVIVFQDWCGTRPTTSTPRALRPRSRTILVLSAVSSMNTSRAGSSSPCSRIQRRRARATSARCCSAARKTFFERDVVSLEKPGDCTLARSNAPLPQFGNGFFQGQIRPFGNQAQYLLGMLFQRRGAAPARLRFATPAVLPAPNPSHGGTRVYLEQIGRLAARSPRLNRPDHTFAQVSRIGLRHRQLPQRSESMPEESLSHRLLGIPPIQIGREAL